MNILTMKKVANNKLLDDKYLSEEDYSCKSTNSNVAFDKNKILDLELYQRISKDNIKFYIALVKENRILKRTFWYDMHTIDSHLTPQLEEDIEEARWVDPQEFLNEELYPKYGNIRDLVVTCLKMR